MVIDITSFEKHLESSLDHTPNFCRNLVIFRSKNMYLKESLNRSSTVIFFKIRRVQDTPNFISSDSKIVKRLRQRHYDLLIIERTIGLVCDPCTALYRLFLKHCTLTNKAVGTIWRALSRPPQVWLLDGTPSAIRPELAFSRTEHSLPYSDVTLNIYFYTLVFIRDILWYGDVRPGLRPSDSPSVCPTLLPTVRVSVRPFTALFSYMLWHIELKFCTWLCFNALQIKFECRHSASIFEELCVFVNLEYRKGAVFLTFLLHAFTYWAENLHMVCTTDQVRVSSLCVNFEGVIPLHVF